MSTHFVADTATLTGRSMRHRSLAPGQRAAKAHPAGRSKGLGISPVIAFTSRRRAGSGTKVEAISAAV